MEKAKVITICGSLKFEKKMRKETERLALEGNCVLSVIYPASSDFNKEDYTKEQSALFDKLHLQKIDMSDAIFVVNVNGYIGNSTKNEIEYAKSKEKEIIFLEDMGVQN